MLRAFRFSEANSCACQVQLLSIARMLEKTTLEAHITEKLVQMKQVQSTHLQSSAHEYFGVYRRNDLESLLTTLRCRA